MQRRNTNFWKNSHSPRGIDRLRGSSVYQRGNLPLAETLSGLLGDNGQLRAEESKGLHWACPHLSPFCCYNIVARFTTMLQLQRYRYSFGHVSSSTVQFPCFSHFCQYDAFDEFDKQPQLPREFACGRPANIPEDRWFALSFRVRTRDVR